MSALYDICQIEPLCATFGIRITELDLRELDAATFTLLRQAFDSHGLLIFSRQHLCAGDQLAFAKRFGPLETFPEAQMQKDSEKIYNVSNTDADGHPLGANSVQVRMLKGTERWHTDSSYRAIPALASFLYAVELSGAEGNTGQTEFADMFAAFDALPEELARRVHGRHMVHDYEYERIHLDTSLPPLSREDKAQVPPVTHPVIRYHPSRKRCSIYITANTGGEIGGMDRDAGRALHQELLAFATQPKFIYRHAWSQGDLLVWDNRRLLHRVLPYDAGQVRRIMRRTSVAEQDAPSAPWMNSG